jgi:hypothetical protein
MSVPVLLLTHLSIYHNTTKQPIQSSACTVIGATVEAKPGNGEGCTRKGIWHKVLALATARVSLFPSSSGADA